VTHLIASIDNKLFKRDSNNRTWYDAAMDFGTLEIVQRVPSNL